MVSWTMLRALTLIALPKEYVVSNWIYNYDGVLITQVPESIPNRAVYQWARPNTLENNRVGEKAVLYRDDTRHVRSANGNNLNTALDSKQYYSDLRQFNPYIYRILPVSNPFLKSLFRPDVSNSLYQKRGPIQNSLRNKNGFPPPKSYKVPSISKNRYGKRKLSQFEDTEKPYIFDPIKSSAPKAFVKVNTRQKPYLVTNVTANVHELSSVSSRVTDFGSMPYEGSRLTSGDVTLIKKEIKTNTILPNEKQLYTNKRSDILVAFRTNKKTIDTDSTFFSGYESTTIRFKPEAEQKYTVFNEDSTHGTTDDSVDKIAYKKSFNYTKHFNKNVELTENQKIFDRQRIEELSNKFLDAVEKLDRKLFNTTFNKLTSICPAERSENGISFAQSGLFLSLLLLAFSTEVDEEADSEINQSLELNMTNMEKIEVIKHVVSILPPSTDDLKFRWASRLVLGVSQNVSEEFTRGAASALHLILGKMKGNETDEERAQHLNKMVEQDSGGAIHNTFEPEEVSGGVRAAALTTVYLRGRWQAAPTVLNGSRPFHDAATVPHRTARMIRLNDIMRYARLDDFHFHALEISYSTPGLSLLLFVPFEESLRPVARHLVTARLGHITRRMQTMRVAATMPLYTLRMTLLLPSKLQTMGINKLISTNNSNDNGRLRLSHAVQRVMFWSEAGRNAFKDDGIEWDDPPELELVVDRPYIFFVRWNNITLMSGNFVL